LTKVKCGAGAWLYFRCIILPSGELRMPTQNQTSERIPAMQRVLDNPFLLLFLGVVIPTVLYILWGVMEVASIPLAK
jgi:hypothetical protein